MSENIKDVRTVASAAALIAVTLTSSYFYTQISEIKKEQEELKKYVKGIVLAIDPNVGERVNLAMKDIQTLDSRLAKIMGDIQILNETTKTMNDKIPRKKTYQRLTKKGDNSTVADILPTHITSKIDNEIDDDVAAMT